MAESRMGRMATMLLLGLTLGGCTPMDDLLAGIFGRSMRNQPSVGAYENPRLPPEGSVPFAAPNYPASPDQVGLGQPEGSEIPPAVTPFQLLTSAPEAQPAIAQRNPVPATAESLERGRVMYERSCTPCHASSGAGDGLVTRAGVPPRSLLTPEARALSDGYIYTIIRVGRGAMPQYGHQITHFDRWHLVNYVRQLQAGGADDA
jgi:mono/diheme cytochrome c family protein